MDYFFIILMTVAMVISVVEDIRRLKIPNWVTFPTILLAMVYHSASGGLEGLLFSIGGLAAGIGIFIIPYLMGGMGAGDAKLMGAAGTILGPKGVIAASVLVILAGGVYGLILFVLNPRSAAAFLKRLCMTIKTFFLTAQFIIIPPGKDENQPVLRYAIPIAIGTLSYMAYEIKGYEYFAQLIGIHFSIFMT